MPVEITVHGICSDMDGTLVDSTPAVEAALSAWCRTQNVEPAEFFRVSHGVRTRDNIKKFMTVPVLGTSLSEDELTAEVDRLELEIANEGGKLAEAGGRGILALPGVDEFVQKLSSTGARWGVVTSATNAYATIALKTSGLLPPDPPFLITAENCHHGKPHPEPYLNGVEALKKLPSNVPIKAANVLVLEDAPSGLASGLAAGCQTLAVCTGQGRAKIEQTEATYKVLDMSRVQIVRADKDTITLRLTLLHEEP